MKAKSSKKTIFWIASKSLINMTLPMFCTSVLNICKRFFGMIMISYLGRDALAAGALITTIQTTLFVFIWSVMFSVGVVVARAYGAKEYREVGIIWRQSFLLAFLLSIPASIFMWFIPNILHFCGQPAHVINLTTTFFHILAFCVLPSIWMITASQFFVGISRPKVALAWSIFNLPVTVLIGYALIFGHFGMPKLGIDGFAYATTIVWWLSAITTFIYFVFSKNYKQFALFEIARSSSYKYLRKLFQVGWPISIQNGAELLAWTIGTIMIGWFGGSALGAQQVVIQIMMISMMFGFVIAQASGVLIGHSIGRKDHTMTQAIAHAGLVIGVLILSVFGLIFLILPKELIRIFVNINDPHNAMIVHLAITLFAVEAFILVVDGARNILTGALRGFHDTKVPMVVGIFVIWIVGLPLGYLMAFTFHWGPVGIYIAQLIGVFIGVIILWRRFEHHIRRIKYYE